MGGEMRDRQKPQEEDLRCAAREAHFSRNVSQEDMEIEVDEKSSELARQRSSRPEDRDLRAQARDAQREFAPGAAGAVAAAQSFSAAAVRATRKTASRAHPPHIASLTDPPLSPMLVTVATRCCFTEEQAHRRGSQRAEQARRQRR